MTQEPRKQWEQQILEQIERDIPAVDPDVQRAVEAVRNSTPNHLINVLEGDGLLEDMLKRMRQRFDGRPLSSISNIELIQIARDSVDETIGITPPERSTAFPHPLVLEQTPERMATEVMEQVANTVRAWKTGEIDVLAAATQVEEIIYPTGRTAS